MYYFPHRPISTEIVPHIDFTLIQKGDHIAYDDAQLLNAMTERIPTSFKLHTIRDAWDALIRYDLQKTREKAEQLRALVTKAPVGTRGWWLLRDEADRLQQHNALTKIWISNRGHAQAPEVQRKPRKWTTCRGQVKLEPVPPMEGAVCGDIMVYTLPPPSSFI